MDAPVIAALISAPLSFAGALAGVLITNRFARKKHVDERLDVAIERLHGTNESLASDAYNQICDLVRFEKLTKAQKARIRTSSQTYISRPKGGNLEPSPPPEADA